MKTLLIFSLLIVILAFLHEYVFNNSFINLSDYMYPKNGEYPDK